MTNSKKLVYLVSLGVIFTSTAFLFQNCGQPLGPSSDISSNSDPLELYTQIMVARYGAVYLSKSSGDTEVWGSRKPEESMPNHFNFLTKPLVPQALKNIDIHSVHDGVGYLGMVFGIGKDRTFFLHNGAENKSFYIPNPVAPIAVASAFGHYDISQLNDFEYTPLCFVTSDGQLTCVFGDETRFIDPSEVYRSLAMNATFLGATYICGITKDSKMKCSTSSHTEVIQGIERHIPKMEEMPSSSRFQSLSAGPSLACALTEEGSIQCTDLDFFFKDPSSWAMQEMDSREYRSVSVGDRFLCGIQKSNDRAFCTTDLTNQGLGARVYPGMEKYARKFAAVDSDLQFSSISVGHLFVCGIDLKHHNTYCWGETATNGFLSYDGPDGEAGTILINSSNFEANLSADPILVRSLSSTP